MTRTISIAACLLAFSTPAWAQSDTLERAKASFKAGAAAYAAGEYLAAIQALARLAGGDALRALRGHYPATRTADERRAIEAALARQAL